MEIYTSDDEMIEGISEEVYVTPELSGVDISDIELERKDNLVGGLDFLKLYIPRMEGSFTVDTDMVVELPENLAFFKRGQVPLCQRTFVLQGASSLVDVECDIETFEDADQDSDDDDEEEEEEEPELVKIKSIRLKALCNQYHVCISRQDLEF